ncbi:MAG: hypothetical protein CRN43_20545 [Candidatus Nephrothrix sp. EaCA]|nr:MAG: hypothetical protein CRN43_20545 [Candidatus Nephrothrix sp. EaCA]
MRNGALHFFDGILDSKAFQNKGCLNRRKVMDAGTDERLHERLQTTACVNVPCASFIRCRISCLESARSADRHFNTAINFFHGTKVLAFCCMEGI